MLIDPIAVMHSMLLESIQALSDQSFMIQVSSDRYRIQLDFSFCLSCVSVAKCFELIWQNC
jgi:hypothetical protein